jgi:hypothetical protein
MLAGLGIARTLSARGTWGIASTLNSRGTCSFGGIKVLATLWALRVFAKSKGNHLRSSGSRRLGRFCPSPGTRRGQCNLLRKRQVYFGLACKGRVELDLSFSNRRKMELIGALLGFDRFRGEEAMVLREKREKGLIPPPYSPPHSSRFASSYSNRGRPPSSGG